MAVHVQVERARDLERADEGHAEDVRPDDGMALRTSEDTGSDSVLTPYSPVR
jgi:hypothetical protein